MTDCIFCKIVEGEIPSMKIYEDGEVYAFLDTNPLTPGHTLIIPKEHYEDIFDVPEELLAKLILSSKKVSQILKKKLKCDGINLFNSNGKVAQQDVLHYHIHVIPRYAKSNFKIKPENILVEKNLNKTFEKIKE